MQQPPEHIRPKLEAVARIIRDAGGKIVGRTKLQKTTYILGLAGLESEFQFSYKYFGPFGEDLASSAEVAAAFGFVTEIRQPASSGGAYSVYEVAGAPAGSDNARRRLAHAAAASDAILLELAATAAYLAREGREDPWTETERRKPDKAAAGRLARAKALRRDLKVASGDLLPTIAMN